MVKLPESELSGIFKRGQKVWVFGKDKGIIVKETDPRIFLVKIEDSSFKEIIGLTLQVDYFKLLPREQGGDKE